jgi:hypothetical protein
MNADVHPVVDPALGPRTQRWVRRLIARKNWPADKLVIERVGPIALAVCILGAFLNGLSDPWLVTVAASAVATFAVRREVRGAGLRRFRRSFVEPSDLDVLSSQRLQAVQAAIDTVCGSEVYQTGRLNSPVRAAHLRQHEWELARRLADISSHRAEYTTSRSEGVPGPHTAAVLVGHRRAIDIAQDSTTRRVKELQRFASEVRASDLALEDLRKAEKLALRNDRYLDLVAATAADEYAIAELTQLTDDAARARDAYTEALDRAMLAAGPLTLSLPD